MRTIKAITAGLVVSMMIGSQSQAGQVSRKDAGVLPDGRRVEAVTLANAHGLSATILTLGATLSSVLLPDRHGTLADVALGNDTLEGYVTHPAYFGATVGRFANRIAKGRFILDGREYQLPVNDGQNALHGGTTGFDKRLWTLVEAKDGRVVLRLVSENGDQGYPGTLVVTATYILSDDNSLSIQYRATTDRPTVVNITNHAYWNLAGVQSGRSAMDHVLTIPAAAYLPTDAGLIPTGEIRSVAGTPFDFRSPRPIGEQVRNGHDPQIAAGRGYDHNYVLGRDTSVRERLMARVVEPVSGRAFELWSNQPGLQLYSGNFLDALTAGKGGVLYRQGDAIALEPQIFPDTPNQPAFGLARLAPGQVYLNTMTYHFLVMK